MACIPGHLLVPDLVIGPTDPVFRKSTHIAINLLILIESWSEIGTVESIALVPLFELLEYDGVFATVREDLPFNLADRRSKSLIFGRDVSCIAW